MVSVPDWSEARQECEASATRSHAETPGTQRISLFWSHWRPWRHLCVRSNLQISTDQFQGRGRVRRISATRPRTLKFDVLLACLPPAPTPRRTPSFDPREKQTGSIFHPLGTRDPQLRTSAFCLLPSKSKIADRKSRISQLPQTRPIVTHPGPGLARLSQILDLGR